MNEVFTKTPTASASEKRPSYWQMGEEASNYSPASMNKLLQNFFAFSYDTQLMDDINLNAKTIDFELSTSPFNKRKARLVLVECVPTTIVPERNYPEAVCSDFHKMVSSIQSGTPAGKSRWVMHLVPSCIEVSAQHLSKMFSGDVDFDHDIVNLMMRCFKQAEDLCDQAGITHRRKHFMESNFLMRLLAGEDPNSFVPIRDQFIGDHVGYDVPNCKLIMLPAYVPWAWVCYAIDLIEKNLTVYEPTM